MESTGVSGRIQVRTPDWSEPPVHMVTPRPPLPSTPQVPESTSCILVERGFLRQLRGNIFIKGISERHGKVRPALGSAHGREKGLCHLHNVGGPVIWLKFSSDSHVFHEQSGREVEFHGARLWAGLQSEKEDTGSCGLQPDSGQEEGETDGGKRRIPPGAGIVGRTLDASMSSVLKRVRSAGNMRPADQKGAIFHRMDFPVCFFLRLLTQVFIANLEIVVPFRFYLLSSS